MDCISTTAASFVAMREIIKRGKPFTDGEYMKDSFIKISEHLFSDFKKKAEIIQKIKDMPLSAKTVKGRAIKMASNITYQQIKDINSAPASSIGCDESCDGIDIEQAVLLCSYVNSDRLQEAIIKLIPLKGQTWGEDICEAVLKCLNDKGINTNHLISVATDGAPRMRGSQKGFVTWSAGLESACFSLHLTPRSTVCIKIPTGVYGGDEPCHPDGEQDNCKNIKPPSVP